MGAVNLVLVCSLLMILANPSYAKIYKWVDEDGRIHFSDRKNHSVKQEVVNVKPGSSNWSRFDIKIETVDVELSDKENQQIVDGVNNVYEFFDRVMFFDMYRTVPVNILIFKDKTGYRKYLVSKNKGQWVASYGLYIPSEHQIVVYVQQNRSRTFKTIKHEVSHAVVDTIVPYSPAWLNEGLAEQMEMLERDEKSLYFEHHAHNLGVVAQAGQFLYFLFSKPTRRNFVVRLMRNFNRGDRTLSYYLVDNNYIGGVKVLELDWRNWLLKPGKRIIRL